MVTERVLETMKTFEKVDASKLSSDAHFKNDLGLDSLDAVEVVMAIEEEFMVEIPDADAEKIQSCRGIVAQASCVLMGARCRGHRLHCGTSTGQVVASWVSSLSWCGAYWWYHKPIGVVNMNWLQVHTDQLTRLVA